MWRAIVLVRARLFFFSSFLGYRPRHGRGVRRRGLARVNSQSASASKRARRQPLPDTARLDILRAPWRALAVEGPKPAVLELPGCQVDVSFIFPSRSLNSAGGAMECIYRLPFLVLEVPNLKLKRPSWFVKPSAMVVFSFILLSYFLVTGAEPLASFILLLFLSNMGSKKSTHSTKNSAKKNRLTVIILGIIYDVIVEPPSVGSTTDEHGHTRPVAFMPYRVNGQYIMEGLASSFLFTMGGLGFIILDQTHGPSTPKLNRVLLICVGFLSILVSFTACWIFMKMKLPGYLQS